MGGTPGFVAQLVRAPPCHGGGCGFKSHRGRYRSKPVVQPEEVAPPRVSIIRKLEQKPQLNVKQRVDFEPYDKSNLPITFIRKENRSRLPYSYERSVWRKFQAG